jgi:transcriptional regulator with XRE-family HTH domain
MLLTMSEHEKQRHAASQAVIDLRAALNKTQAQFAVETMKTAVTTVGRWETSHPPRGEALLRLAEVAAHSKDSSLAGEFYELYLLDVIAHLPFDLLLARATETQPNRGFLIEKLIGDDELKLAREFVNKLQRMRLTARGKAQREKEQQHEK